MQNTKYKKYIERVCTDALNAINRPKQNTKYQYVIFNNRMILVIFCPYHSASKRIVYRVTKNIAKVFPELTGADVYVLSNWRFSEMAVYDLYQMQLPPHHTVARCDFGGKPTCVIDPSIYHDPETSTYLADLKAAGFDWLEDGIHSSSMWNEDRYQKYVDARHVMGTEIPNLTDQIVSGAL